MTPAARLQTAIELLDAIIESAVRNGAAADTLIAEGMRARRYAGSGDRRAIRELIYRAIRRFGEVPMSGRAAMVALADEDVELAAMFDGSPYGPAPVSPDEVRAFGGVMPAMLATIIDKAEHQALLDRAPLDLRINPAKTNREAMLAHFPGSVPIVGLNHGLRIDSPISVEQDDAWRDGLVEVQDAGSQWIGMACGIRPGMTVLDLCAGAGGKTLALAADMAGEGRLIAADTDRGRLQRLAPRAERAGAAVEVRLLNGGQEAAMLGDLAGQCDVVLVDAPCSGTGTLRRNPEARWRIDINRLATYTKLQAHVLELAAPLVKPGGALVYAVCSLIAGEGPGAIDRFVARHGDWTIEPPFEVGRPAGLGRALGPAREQTDGFFVARLIAPC